MKYTLYNEDGTPIEIRKFDRRNVRDIEIKNIEDETSFFTDEGNPIKMPFLLTLDGTKIDLQNTHIVNLYRIKYLIDIPEHRVKPGDLGGWIESEDNLSHYGNCVVLNNACVYGDTRIIDNACIKDNAIAFDCAKICGNAIIEDNALVGGNACISGDACICGDSIVCDFAQILDRVSISGNACIKRNAALSGEIEIIGGTWENAPIFVKDEDHSFYICDNTPKKELIKIDSFVISNEVTKIRSFTTSKYENWNVFFENWDNSKDWITDDQKNLYKKICIMLTSDY